MRVKTFSLAITASLCCVLFFAPAIESAETVQFEARGKGGKISLDFKDIDIIEALKFISQTAGLNIIPTSNVQGRVTLMVENAPLEDVLEIMLRSHDLAYDKHGEIYNVMSKQEYLDRYGRNFSDIREVEIFQLSYAVPEQAFELCNTLKSEVGKILLNSESGSILVIDTPSKLVEIKEAIKSLENKNTVLKVYDLKYAQAKDLVAQLKNQLDVKKVGTIRADVRTNQVIVQALPARISDIDKLVADLDKKTREVLIEVRIIRIAISDARTKGVQWEGLFQIAASSGLGYLGSYPFSAVQAATDAWRSRLTVHEGGIAPDGTEVKGLDYVGGYPASGTITNPLQYNRSQPVTGLGNLHVGMVGHHDTDVIFRYLQTIGETKVVAAPKLAVINNQKAKIHIGEKQAYVTNTTTQTSSTTTIAEEVTFIDVGIQLYLTPTINEDGFVTIKIAPEISSIASFLTTAEGNRIPIINSSTAETTVMVKDASTILLGGLKEERATKNEEAVPFLSRIPLLGNLFKNSSNTESRSELLLMVTPHIISGDELSTGYARDFGSELDKVDQAYSSIVSEKAVEAYHPYREYQTVKKDDPEDELEPPMLKPMKEMP